MSNLPANGIVTLPARHSVAEVLQRLHTLLNERGITIFATIDHSGEAVKAGLTMPETKLVIFGSPKAGTPLMQASPGIALDLPLKILIAADEAGRTTLSYNAPEYLAQRHNLPPELLANIAAVGQLAAAAAG